MVTNLDEPIPAEAHARESAAGEEAGTLADLDEAARVEVAMPRDLFDRLTDHDDAPRCRYDMATGRAEFVAAPTLSHESRAATVGDLFSQIEFALADAGSGIEVRYLARHAAAERGRRVRAR